MSVPRNRSLTVIAALCFTAIASAQVVKTETPPAPTVEQALKAFQDHKLSDDARANFPNSAKRWDKLHTSWDLKQSTADREKAARIGRALILAAPLDLPDAEFFTLAAELWGARYGEKLTGNVGKRAEKIFVETILKMPKTDGDTLNHVLRIISIGATTELEDSGKPLSDDDVKMIKKVDASFLPMH